MRCLPSLATALTLGLAAAGGFAQTPVYTWVDSQGVRHYAQTPPEGVAYEERGVADRALGNGQPATAKPDDRTPEEVRACDRARLAVQQLDSPMALQMDKDGDGKPETLTADERALQRRLAEQSVAAYCPRPDAGTTTR